MKFAMGWMMLSNEQKLNRKTGIGGSDAAAVCGVSSFKTPIDVYREKTSNSIKEESENKYAYWGNILEPLILSEYEKETGFSVYKPDKMYRSEKYPWMIAHVDGLIENQNAVLECKTTSFYNSKEWGEMGSDYIPKEYLLQVAHYAVVLDVSFVDIAVLIGGNDFRTYRYVRNADLEGELIKAEDIFWNKYVKDNICPEPINKEDILKLYSDVEKDSIIRATDKIEKEYCNLINIRKKINELDELKKQSEFEIQLFMKNSDFLVGSDGKKLVTFRTQKRKTLNKKKFDQEYPNLLDKFYDESKIRVFRVF